MILGASATSAAVTQSVFEADGGAPGGENLKPCDGQSPVRALPSVLCFAGRG